MIELVFNEICDLLRFVAWLLFATTETDYRKWGLKSMEWKDLVSMDMITIYVLVVALIVYCM